MNGKRTLCIAIGLATAPAALPAFAQAQALPSPATTPATGLTELTLKLLQERTPLMRCHRQYLINLKHIAEIELLENGAADILTRSGKRIPVSRRHLREIKDKLLIP